MSNVFFSLFGFNSMEENAVDDSYVTPLLGFALRDSALKPYVSDAASPLMDSPTAPTYTRLPDDSLRSVSYFQSHYYF